MQPLVVVTDFNETLVLERTLPRWCSDRLRSGSLGGRIRAALACAACGLLARTADAMGFDTTAASIGLRALNGVRVSDLERWAQTRLTLNPHAEATLSRLFAERGRPLALTVVSRGSPGVIVRAFLATPAIATRIAAFGVVTKVIAPELHESQGMVTGRLRIPAAGKASRVALLSSEAVYLGDARDRDWISASGDARARFIEVGRPR